MVLKTSINQTLIKKIEGEDESFGLNRYTSLKMINILGPFSVSKLIKFDKKLMRFVVMLM